MKPIKALLPLSLWLMRIGLVLFAYVVYFKIFTDFNLSSIKFYFAALFLIFSILIFITGIIRKPELTVVSALILTAITVYGIFKSIDAGININLVINILVGAITVFFLSGNGK